ncbi:hypothetical protein ACIGXM_23735 [Kitasatospora sp. NPDC052896]|uniref:hypothetical protein n=1 Tax=Kitasatospora sp. NPDC052896 TaxID=3364061 RepID=UPI0037C795F7
MTSRLQRHMHLARTQAVHALADLTDSLDSAGIVLPSAALDDHAPCTGVVLIELGRARADVVLRMAQLIRIGVRHEHS